MNPVHPSIACNLDADILSAALPLFESEKVQAIEWSFDALFKVKNVPDWFRGLLEAYSLENRLIGHGVYFSLFSGRWLPEQAQWLSDLSQLSKELRFGHVTEHFGFMTGEDFHKGAPIGIPYNAITLAIGRDRLKRIYDACQCPVGLENLAFSYSIEEVKKHGEFLEELVEPINGFIILDLHNLYCQLHNFDIDFEDILTLYPLHRVREIHISGGSWEDSGLLPANKKIRRDTHDESVPEEVFLLLKKTIPRCPNLQFVVLEQLGVALKTPESRRLFQDDFYKMEAIVQAYNNTAGTPQKDSFLPSRYIQYDQPVEDEYLYKQQMELSVILESARDVNHAWALLEHSALARSDWHVERWAPYMLETAMRIAQKWKDGF